MLCCVRARQQTPSEHIHHVVHVPAAAAARPSCWSSGSRFARMLCGVNRALSMRKSVVERSEHVPTSLLAIALRAATAPAAARAARPPLPPRAIARGAAAGVLQTHALTKCANIYTPVRTPAAGFCWRFFLITCLRACLRERRVYIVHVLYVCTTLCTISVCVHLRQNARETPKTTFSALPWTETCGFVRNIMLGGVHLVFIPTLLVLKAAAHVFNSIHACVAFNVGQNSGCIATLIFPILLIIIIG